MVNQLLDKFIDSSCIDVVIYSHVIVSSIKGIDYIVMLLVQTIYLLLLCDLSYVLAPITLIP